MATTFDATFFDSLSDRILKALRLIVVLLQQDEDEIDPAVFVELSSSLEDPSIKDFCQEIIEAHERRFGPVPGY